MRVKVLVNVCDVIRVKPLSRTYTPQVPLSCKRQYVTNGSGVYIALNAIIRFLIYSSYVGPRGRVAKNGTLVYEQKDRELSHILK
jgi:hypothetical protein